MSKLKVLTNIDLCVNTAAVTAEAHLHFQESHLLSHPLCFGKMYQ